MARRENDDYDHVGRKLNHLLYCALYRRTIRLECPTCNKVRLIDAVPLWWLFHRKGWDDRIPAAFRRLYCMSCWPRLTMKVSPRATITRDTPEMTHLPYPSDSEWKRIISRYRS